MTDENIEVSEEKYREAIQRLKESEEKYRTITEQSLMGIVVMQDNVFKYANEGFSAITEYSVEEIMSWTTLDWSKTIHPEDLITMKTRLEKREAGEKDVPPFITFRIFTKSGKIKWIESYGKEINFNGRPATYSVTLDITEKKKSEEKFRLIAENANDIISIINNNFELEYQNMEATNNILGYTHEEILNSNALRRIHPDDVESVIKVFREGFKKGEAQTEMRTRHKDGHHVWFDIKGRTFIDKQGQKKGIIISRDITERRNAEQKLKESEEKFRKITEKSFIGITITQGGIVKYLNETIADLIEYSIPEVLDWEQNAFINVVHPEDRSITVERLKKMENNIERSPFFLCRLITKSGNLKYVNINSKPFLYKGKKAILTTFIDLTEKIIAEQKLRESEEKYRHITEQSLMGIIIMQDNVFKYVNEGMTKLNGYSIQEILNWTPVEWTKTIHPEDLPDILARLKNQEEGKTEDNVKFTFRIVTKSGKIKWVETLGKTFILNNKIAAYSALQDITERKTAEEKLKTSETKYRHLFNSSPDMIFLMNMEGILVDINEKFIANSGYRKEDIINKNFKILTELTSPAALSFCVEKTKEILSKGYIKPVEFSFIDKNGDKSWINFQGHIIELEGGNLIEFVVRDITARMEAQEKLKEALECETFFKKLFTHDINNVLGNIKTSLSLFTLYQGNPEKQEEIRKIINILKEQVVRGAHLVSNIRQLSEIEEENLILERINASKVLQGAIKLIQEGFQNRIIDVKIDSIEDNFHVQANDLLLNVFENILNNAVKYNEHPIVKILIRISEQHEDGINYAKFEFRDNGIGINNLKKSTIFKEGYKEEKGEKGLGFGLSLVKKIIANFNGKIWIEDKIKGDYKNGSNFIILIPKK